MKLVVTEKNDAAQKIADLLGATKPKADKVYSTPVYRFTVEGEEWITIAWPYLGARFCYRFDL